MPYATICSAKSYYAAAKANDPDRKIMQIPLFLGAIAIFYVSDETILAVQHSLLLSPDL